MHMLLSLLVVLLLVPGTALADAKAPTSLAGFSIGENVANIKDKVDLTESDKEFDRPYVMAAPIVPLPGFRSGYVAYGDCKDPGRILRIKLNYKDGSLAFFEKLLSALKKKYGAPEEWRGNPFGTLRTWKWSMTSETGDDVSLILMHYQGDDGTYTRGNSIRINAWNLINAEEECYKAKTPEKKPAESPDLEPANFDWYLPR